MPSYDGPQMARRKSPSLDAEQGTTPAPKNAVVSEVAALLASIDSLSQSWPKGPDGQPVRLGDASMPSDVAERVGQALQTASGSVARAAALLGQHTLGRPSEAATDPSTRAAYAMLQSATNFPSSRPTTHALRSGVAWSAVSVVRCRPAPTSASTPRTARSRSTSRLAPGTAGGAGPPASCRSAGRSRFPPARAIAASRLPAALLP